MNRDLSNVDERLPEWAAYHKDRARLQKCGSLEGNYQRHAGEPDPDGWGEPTVPAQKPIRERNWVLRAIKTNEAVMQLNIVQKWCVTYHYCYPGLPRFVILRAVKRFTKRHLTWKDFQDQVEIARFRLAVLLK